ncbi:TetR/AcrR family transcriptional regulator [Nocardia alni]|uniref:TetR/AcrR family transcriptional regulator n=1 Tax=Nocardia alni TaxID=2815723 RepID=UPI001C23A3EA|nr:TetR/AcrR family transcriptional regulator [Nocardia alni]
MSRDQSILEAAARLFAERGFAGVGVDALATEAGITGSAVYRHFSSKDEILATLFDRLMDTLLMRMGDEQPDPHAELDRLIAIHVEFVLANPELTTIWQREQSTLAALYQRSFARRQRLYVDRWIQALDRCYPGHDRSRLATTVRALHSLISSDLSRPANVKKMPGLPGYLESMARATCAALSDYGG